MAIAPLTIWISHSQRSSLAPQAEEPKLGSQSQSQIEEPWVETLTDANYRYINTEIPTAEKTVDGLPVVTAADLAEVEEGYAFLFQKVEGQIVGMLYQLASQEKVCVSGKAEGNTVTGQAIVRYESPFTPIKVLSQGEEFAPWGNTETLQVRQGSRTGIRVVYDGALLDLNGFYRVNAGSQPPPEQCV